MDGRVVCGGKGGGNKLGWFRPSTVARRILLLPLAVLALVMSPVAPVVKETPPRLSGSTRAQPKVWIGLDWAQWLCVQRAERCCPESSALWEDEQGWQAKEGSLRRGGALGSGLAVAEGCEGRGQPGTETPVARR